MFAGKAREGTIDRMAICLSGLCLVHCIASAVFVAFLAAGGSFLLDPIFHEVGMSIALVLGVVGFGRGIIRHGFMLPASVGGLGLGVMAGSLVIGHENGGTFYSILGVLIVALGHDLNRRAVI
jgi:hypothetical protein